jgi:hypothetical protein
LWPIFSTPRRELRREKSWPGSKLPYRTFRVLKYHLSGFTDDELRKILVRAGIRFAAGGHEIWGLLARNREYLSVDEIKEDPTTQISFDALGNSRTSRSMMLGLKTNWIFHVTHPGPLSVCVPR